ncbi:MAG: tetratricopeptide repeat protein [Blastocatellia bacterium]|nr:tetratricopeptide repeat protein [Blastocatellia bacterium]
MAEQPRTHYLTTGAYDQARSLLERLLETRTRLFGPEHPETLAAIANLASVRGTTGETRARAPAVRKRTRNQQEALRIRQRADG